MFFSKRFKIILYLVLSFFLTLSFLFSFQDHVHPITLNEVVACNHSIIYDNTGEFHDYIELYNNSNSQIDISGYALSDSKKQLNKFIFPENTFIKSKQYYLVWAQKKPENIFVENNHLYTNFALKNGEKIYFSDKNGKVIDKIKIPKDMECDTSYSKLPFTSVWKQRKPSPLKKNIFSKTRKDIILPNINVTASHQSGFYGDPFWLELFAPKGFDIFYTLDASRPTENSLKYEGPIKINDASFNPNKYANIKNISTTKDVYVPNFNIDKAMIVRAVAIRQNDKAMSKISNFSYFVGFQNKKEYKNIPVVSIITDPDNLFDYEKGIYVTGKLWDMNNRNKTKNEEHINYWARGKDWSRPAYVDMFNSQHELQSEDDIQIKINGGYSRHNAQKSFKFEIKSSGERWLLKNGGSLDVKQVKITEFLIWELFKNRKGVVYAPQDFVICFLNGEFWGVYVLTPEKNESFLSEFLGQKDTDFSLIKDGMTNMPRDMAFLRDLKKGIIDKADLSTLCDETSINIYNDKSDWSIIKWNSVIYYNKKFDKYYWLLHDLEVPFSKENTLMFPQIYKKLMKNEKVKRECFIAFQDIANYYFDPVKINRIIDKISEKYSDSMVSSFRRFQTEKYTKENYMEQINMLRDFYENRFNYIMPYMKEYLKLKGDLLQIRKDPSLVEGGRILLNTLTLEPHEEYIGQYFSDYPISLDVEVFDGYIFQGWVVNGKKYDNKKIEIDINGPQEIEAVFEKKTHS